MVFTDSELHYLTEHPLGRLATIGPDGTPQIHPVAFSVGPEGVIQIGGPDLANSQKFRNVRDDPRASFVVDDQSETPNPLGQTGRGIEIRGRIEIVTQEPPLIPGFSHETFYLHPQRIICWNIGPFAPAGLEHPTHLQGYNSRNILQSDAQDSI